MKWDIAEETKFRHLLRRKIDEDILKFELAALRTLKPEEFFASRPYLVPPFVELLKDLPDNSYKNSLKVLHNKYRAVMMRRRIQFLNDKENKWLMEKLGIVFERSYIITKKEIAWLKEHKQQLTQDGSQPGSRLEPLSSQPSEIDYSSQKTNSGLAMSAEVVQVEERSPVQTVKEQEQLEQSSSAPPVKEQEQ